jgi:ABC-type transport system involved in multi-copper enzyme maturation permease subunit
MLLMFGLSLICYAVVGALLILEGRGMVSLLGRPIAPPPLPVPEPGVPFVLPPPTLHADWQSLFLTLGGLFALLGIGEPFLRDVGKIARKNVSVGLAPLKRYLGSVRNWVADLLTARQARWLAAALAIYGLIGVGLYALEASRLFSIWLGWLLVAVGVLLGALFVLLLFEAEGPIWAVAKLSFKEALSSQMLWIFLLVLVPYAFRNIWMANIKPSDEIRALIDVTNVVLAVLILVPAVLLASFYGLPNDIKNLNIYTTASKPVERFELVLGRFVGYVALMTLVLLGLAGVNLVLIENTNISERARQETYKARVPVRGKLEFGSLEAQYRREKKEFTGENVGREFDYRRYIAGHPLSAQRAIWHFDRVPTSLATVPGDRVPVEFTFDIYRMTKGEQNRGVSVHFRFVTHQALQRPPRPNEGGEWHWRDEQREQEYRKAVEQLRARGINPDAAVPGTPAWDEANKLAEQFGFFEIRGKEVFDYTVMGVEIPAGLIRNALQGEPPRIKGKDGQERPAPRLSVYVKCESPGQMLGMAEPDLYLLEYEQPFAWNYLKSMVGYWCWLCIVIGIAVACGTYLSSVLSLLATTVIFIFGFFPEHLADVAYNRNIGGGPIESMTRLIQAQQPTTPLSESVASRAVTLFDRITAWIFRRIQNVIPDMESFNWSSFVAEGFNVNTEYLVVNVLTTFGYLLPWGILAYYLIKTREVAA